MLTSQTMLPRMFRLRPSRKLADLDDRLLADIAVERHGNLLVHRDGLVSRSCPAKSQHKSFFDVRYRRWWRDTMFGAFDLARFGVVVFGVVVALALPVNGEDFAAWTDREVNAALAHARLILAAQERRADAVPCATMVVNDTAAAIDCEVNQYLNAGSHLSRPGTTTTMVALPQ